MGRFRSRQGTETDIAGAVENSLSPDMSLAGPGQVMHERVNKHEEGRILSSVNKISIEPQ